MKSPTDWMSCSSPWNWLADSPSTGRLYPVETGSIKTRSVKSSQHDSLSASAYGGGGVIPSGPMTTRLGPSAPMCSHTDDEPGPPLYAKVIDRVAGSIGGGGGGGGSAFGL